MCLASENTQIRARKATRMGWRLERSKARSEYTAGHGLYRIVNATSGAYVAGGEPYPFSLLLKEVEALLWGGHHPLPARPVR